MYQRIEIDRFRGLRDLVVDGLGRVNLLVGPNNSGKTSLLEALFLLRAPGNPLLTQTLAVFRGLQPPGPAPGPAWATLFPVGSALPRCRITGYQSDGAVDSRELAATREWLGQAPTEPTNGQHPEQLIVAGTASGTPETLRYAFRRSGGPVVQSGVSLGLGRLAIQQALELTEPAAFLPARLRTGAEEMASRFTRLGDAGRTDEVVAALAVLQPGLRELSLGYYLDSETRRIEIRAHVAGLAAPLPLQALGDGVNRLAEILLAVADVGGGVCLVDEAENGLSHRNLETAWRAIEAASRAAAVQLFATTHSAECVQAAVRAFAGPQAEAFRLYRLEATDQGTRAVRYDHADAAAALEFALEFR